MVYEIKVYEYTRKHPHFNYYSKELPCSCACGEVTAYNQQVGGLSTRSSCDLLQSSGKNKNKSLPAKIHQKEIGQWLYTSLPTRMSISTLKSKMVHNAHLRHTLGYQLETFVPLLDKACQVMRSLTSDGCVPYEQHVSEYISENLLTLTKKNHDFSNSGFALYLPTKTHIVAMGDIHGSFHTFWRHMMRLRASNIIISLQRLQLSEGHTLVFTGDVVDRGNFSIDILIIILRLICANPPGKVVYVRGNHEDIMLSVRYGFYEELSAKFPDPLLPIEARLLMNRTEYKHVKPKKVSTAIHVLAQCQKFWACCPVAVVIAHPETHQRLWFSHGGIPREETLAVIHESDTPYIIEFTNSESSRDCLWCDFLTDQDTRPKDFGRPPLFPPETIDFMSRHKLSFIIRGHQDRYVNTYLLSNHHHSPFISGSRLDLIGSHTPNSPVISVSSLQKTNGSIAIIRTEDAIWLRPEGVTWESPEGPSQVWPVLTISTATDIDRKLLKDGIIYVSAGPSDGIRCPTVQTHPYTSRK